MNPQPYQAPPQWWPSLLSPTLVRWWQPILMRSLSQQGIERIDIRGAEIVPQLLQNGAGVLVAANHSFHYDSRVLIHAGVRGGWCGHFLTAWQVFGMVSRIEQWMLQKHGCFSINREGTDTQAFKQAVSILTDSSHPLIVFPEGDIFHSNDCVMPFQDGVGAIPLSAARKNDRPLYVVPCALKCVYTDDPTGELMVMMDRLEAYLSWRPAPERPLLERIYRFGQGFLSLKEIEYLGASQSGDLPRRIQGLANAILEQVRQRHDLKRQGVQIAEQIRRIRTFLIAESEAILPTNQETTATKMNDETRERWDVLQRDLQDMFFVTQLSSYHGNYTLTRPTIERIAETIDKFEEDVFQLETPTPRGKRQATVIFGKPINVRECMAEDAKPTARSLTTLIESRVQSLLDDFNGTTSSLVVADAG